MATPLVTHKLDITGVNPDNLVSGETVDIKDISTDNLFLIVPKFGYFYTNGFVLQENGIDVPRNKYKFTEYYHTASLKYGKQICGSILVTVDGLTGPLTYDYQALGGINSRSTGNVIDVYYEKLLPMEVIDWGTLRDRPKQYHPIENHLHNLDEIHDLGRILSYLENIRDAVLTLEFPEYNVLMKYIDEMLVLMQQNATEFLQDKLPVIIDEFKAQFTKEYFGLDKLVNMACSNDREGYAAGVEGFQFPDITVNKYLTLSSLVMFKEALYEGIVDKFSTNLGTREQRFMTPVRVNLLDTPIGGNVTYIGQDVAMNNNIPFSADIYPTGTIGRKQLTAVKLSTFTDPQVTADLRDRHQGSTMLCFDHTNYGVWLGRHNTNNVNDLFRWNQLLVDGSLDALVYPLHAHIKDFGNPHRLDKIQIDLQYVENLKVVTPEVIKALRAERMYITMDRLLDIMHLLSLQNYWMVDPLSNEDERNRFKLDNCQVVYSPCGESGCDDRSDFKEAVVNDCPKKDEILSSYCIYAGTVPELKWEPSKLPITDGSIRGDLFGTKADGNCGTSDYVEESSPNCDVESTFTIKYVCVYDDEEWEPSESPEQGSVFGDLYIVLTDASGKIFKRIRTTGETTCLYKPPKDTLVEEVCRGFTKVGIYTDGLGGSYEKELESNSRFCGYVDNSQVPETRTIPYYVNKNYKYSNGKLPGKWLEEVRDEDFVKYGTVTARVFPKLNNPTSMWYVVNWPGSAKTPNSESAQVFHCYRSPETNKNSPAWEVVGGVAEESFIGSISLLSWTDENLAFYQIASLPPAAKTGECCLGPDLYGTYSAGGNITVVMEQANSPTCYHQDSVAYIRASNTLGSGFYTVPDGMGNYYIHPFPPTKTSKPNDQIVITSRKVGAYEIRSGEPTGQFPYPKPGPWLDTATVRMDASLQIYIEASERRILVDAGPSWGNFGDAWSYTPPLRTFFAWCVPSMGLYSDWEMASLHNDHYRGKTFFRSVIPANAINAPDLRIIRMGGV